MLDKLKLFNKEKQQNAANAAAVANKSQIQSKRTSSSSGFSSARSERSDSSLSLNDGHGSQLKPPSISVASSQKPQPKSKQSKLLAAQQKKEQTNRAKLDKKEKSPARSLNKEESGNESRSSTMGRTGKNSLARAVVGVAAVEKNTPKTSSKSSLHSKSDSKSSLKGPQLLQSPSGTGLPKPIAAIKGTSKLPSLAGNPPAPEPQQQQHHQLLKRETSDISSNISQAAAGDPLGPHILKAAAAPPPYYANSQPPPLPPAHISSHHAHPQMGGYLSEPSTPQHNSGIYGSSRLPPPKSALSAPRKLEYSAGPHILASLPHRQGLQRPLVNSAPNTPTASPQKFHTIPSKIVGTIYETKEELLPPQQQQQTSAGGSVLPMRPLLRGYNSHVTLPTRGARGGHHPHQSYLDFCESDIGQGYCSDGDALRVGSSASGAASMTSTTDIFRRAAAASAGRAHLLVASRMASTSLA